MHLSANLTFAIVHAIGQFLPRVLLLACSSDGEACRFPFPIVLNCLCILCASVPLSLLISAYLRSKPYAYCMMRFALRRVLWGPSPCMWSSEPVPPCLSHDTLCIETRFVGPKPLHLNVVSSFASASSYECRESFASANSRVSREAFHCQCVVRQTNPGECSS